MMQEVGDLCGIMTTLNHNWFKKCMPWLTKKAKATFG